MSLLKVLKISESWSDIQEFDQENCELIDADVRNCMQWLQEYFETKQTSVSRSEKQALIKIQGNYKKIITVLRERQDEIKGGVMALRKNQKSQRLYKDIASI